MEVNERATELERAGAADQARETVKEEVEGGNKPAEAPETAAGAAAPPKQEAPAPPKQEKTGE